MTEEEKRRKIWPDFSEALNDVDCGRKSEPFGIEYLDNLITSYRMGTSRRQVIISFTKWMHGFNVANADVDISFLVKEVAEVLHARAAETVAATVDELADVAIYCYGIAHMLQADLDFAIEEKMRYNIERSYAHSEQK